MIPLFEYYEKYQGVRGGLTRLPSWARAIVLLAALPGLVLAALSILALGVSILALLLLTVPVYRVLKALVGGGAETTTTSVEGFVEPVSPVGPSSGRRHIDVKIVE